MRAGGDALRGFRPATYGEQAGKVARRMSTSVEGGRALLRTRVLGFPVHLDVSFVLVVALLGYRPGVSVRDFALWMVIAPLAVLTHELGHAMAARAAGASPNIALIGFGGVTTFTPPGPLSRSRSLGISLAGPGVGLLLGLALIVADRIVGHNLDPYGWQDVALRIGKFTCLAWSVLNLLPVLPLDGGHALRELLPGDPATRTRRAALVSVVVAGLTAVAALLTGLVFLGLFLLFFAVNNLLTLRELSGRGHANDPTGPGSLPVGTPEQAVVAQLWRSDPDGARRMMEKMSPDVPVDLAVHGAVLALTGDREGGHALLDQEIRRRPGDANAVALLLLTQVLEHDWDAVLVTLHGPLGPTVPEAVIERAVLEARETGGEDVAGRIAAHHRPT